MTTAIPSSTRCASLPDIEIINRTLGMLVGRRMNITPISSSRPSLGTVTATFVDTSTDEVIAICTSDIAFAGAAGAALALIPSGRVKQAIRTGTLEDSLQENAYEVFNIISTFYNDNPPVHVKLEKVYYSKAEVPLDIRKSVRQPTDWCEFTVGIQGYEPGKVSFVVF